MWAASFGLLLDQRFLPKNYIHHLGHGDLIGPGRHQR